MNRPPKVRPKNLTFGGRYFFAKYSFEFKLEIVQEYLDGKGYIFFSKAVCSQSGKLNQRLDEFSYRELGGTSVLNLLLFQ